MTLGFRSRLWSGFGTMAALLFLAHCASAQGNYNNIFSVSPQEMLAGVDAGTVQKLAAANTAVQRNPNDVNALVTRAAISLNIAGRSRYSFQWVHSAALDLEKAIRLDPKNFYALHNYAMACYQAGDDSDAQPNMHLAVIHFTNAIRIKPDSARSYMGRGWAYLMMDDQAHAQEDFQKTLALDPALRDELERQATAISQKRAQKGCVKAMLQRMGAYVVNRNARTAEQCTAVKGFWTSGECRISTAMAPGPLMLGPQDAATGNAGLGGGNCAPVDGVNHKWNARAGGYFVR
jgi:tetratricopeptide (TPR) repeat protein